MDLSFTDALASTLARAIELTGIAVMILGGLLAIARFLLHLAGRGSAAGAGNFDEQYRSLRANLGRAILLGLEFLVAADIIGTVATEPSFRNLGVLALIVAIRTFLSFSLELEISGRWPWQHVPAPQAASQSGAPRSSG